MRIVDQNELSRYKHIHHRKIHEGAIFIYPTDTIYGVGCDATNNEAIEKIRKLKQRPTQPFSIIAPSKEWIYNNCVIPEYAEEWIEKLPGPYTFIFELKNDSAIGGKVNPTNKTIGVRIPDHWISNFVSELGKPIITTSANKHGEEIMTHPDNLDLDFRPNIDFTIYDGALNNPPSSVIKLTDREPSFLRGK